MASNSTVKPADSTSPEGRETVLRVLRRDRAAFVELLAPAEVWDREMSFTNKIRLAAEPQRWRVSDVVAHMTEGIEAYIRSWERAVVGGASTIGDQVAQPAGKQASFGINGPRDTLMSRLRQAGDRLELLLHGLTDEQWTGLLLPHPDPYNRDGVPVVTGPVPAGYFAGFQLIDYAVHGYDIEFGLGNKLATIDETTAGLILPYVFIFWTNTVDRAAAGDLDACYGIDVAGPWGGRWRATVKNGEWSARIETTNFEGCDALFRYLNAADLALTFFGRFSGGSAMGDPAVIRIVRDLFYPF